MPDDTGLGQLADRIGDRLGLLVIGDRTAPARQQSLAATVQWSYRLLSQSEQRVFRLASVFPGPFTLEAVEAVAGPGTGVEAGERPGADAALARYALQVAECAAADLRTSAGEVAAAGRLDAEDATVHQGLTWALEHDRATALRLAVALAPWWRLRGRYAAGTKLLRAAAGPAEPGSKTWCAVHIWLGSAAANLSDFAGALGYFTAVRDAAGQPQPLADALAGRAIALVNLGRIPEGISDARQAVTVARDTGYPAGEALALANLAMAMLYAQDLDRALSWARQACQVDPAAISGRIARWCREVLTLLQMQTRQAAPARSGCQDGLAWSRQAGDLAGQLLCSATIAWLDVWAGDLPQASAYLGQALEIGVRTGGLADLAGCLDCCGHLCAASHRWAEAITIWAAHAARVQADVLPHPPLAAEDRREPLQAARQALGPGQARAAERRGDAPGHRRGIRRHDHADHQPASISATWPREPEPAGTRTTHRARSGLHGCPDRRPIVHQHPYRPLAPGHKGREPVRA